MLQDFIFYFIPVFFAFSGAVFNLYYYSRIDWVPYRIFSFFQIGVLLSFVRLEMKDLWFVLMEKQITKESFKVTDWKLQNLCFILCFFWFNYLLLNLYLERRVYPRSEDKMISLMLRDYRIYISTLIFLILILWTVLSAYQGNTINLRDLFEVMRIG